MWLTSSSSLENDAAKKGAGAPQDVEMPAEEDDLPDYEEDGDESTIGSNGTESMTGDTGRCVDALAIKAC